MNYLVCLPYGVAGPTLALALTAFHSSPVTRLMVSLQSLSLRPAASAGLGGRTHILQVHVNLLKLLFPPTLPGLPARLPLCSYASVPFSTPTAPFHQRQRRPSMTPSSPLPPSMVMFLALSLAPGIDFPPPHRQTLVDPLLFLHLPFCAPPFSVARRCQEMHLALVCSFSEVVRVCSVQDQTFHL